MQRQLGMAHVDTNLRASPLPSIRRADFVSGFHAGLFAMSSSRSNETGAHSSGASYQERLQGKNILVVEDELFISMELEMSLEECGAHVIGPYPSVDEVLRVADELTADAAILDVNLNGVMVFPVADRLLERKIPFVFHTGNADSATLKSLYPGVPVTKKPADFSTLFSLVAELL